MRDSQTPERDRSAPADASHRGTMSARWLSPQEAADYIGVSVSTLRRHRDQIGPSRLGGRLLYDRHRLDQFVESFATGRGEA